MKALRQIYRENLSLLTDLYQITMAYAAWKNGYTEGAKEKQGVFDLFFRTHPFSGGYAVNCGLESVLEFVDEFHFSQSDCDYLASLKGNQGRALFEKGFIEYLYKLRLTVDIDAIEEGRVVFANEPLLRVQGPLIQCQLLETPLLNLVNFETLIATKAARLREAVDSDTILEFGLRRAQGIDGSLTASRACYIGGADSTSNTLAGKMFGIPVKGTHAHSWVMAFEDEKEAFEEFAKAFPDDSVLLVDTYRTLDGVRNAAEIGKQLKSQGHKLSGIRLDSGDLTYLSIEARKILDEAGLKDTKIVASNDLDENLIQNLKLQGARIDIWGVGTKLITAYDQPALGGVFKLTALKDGHGSWQDRIKVSEQISKVTTPGIHQVRRYLADGFWAGDLIYDLRNAMPDSPLMIDPLDPTRRKNFSPETSSEDLLKPVLRKGKVMAQPTSLQDIRERRRKDIEKLHPTIRRFLNPHIYPVGLEASLFERRMQMILEHRGVRP